MSFIYKDNSLISELITKAVEFESKFNKHGQLAADPTVNVEFRNYLNLAKKLADNLKQEFFPPAKDPNALADVGAAQAAGMTVADLNSLGNFFEFIARNQVTVDGKRIAYFGGENPPDKRVWLPVDAERSVLAMETMDQEGNRGPLQAEYYVSKDLLGKYIQTLAASASQEDAEAQRLIKVMLGNLVNRINRIFNTKFSTDYKAPEKTLPADTVMATFPQVLDPKMYNADGPVKLTWGDLTSPNTLRNWVHANKVGIKGKDKTLTDADQDFDYCVVVNTIYGKATYLKSRSTSDDVEKTNDLFVKKITEIGGKFTGPDGKACTLGGSGGGGGGQGGQPGQKPNVSPQALAQVIQRLPFAVRDIDFGRIRLFFEGVKPLLAHVPQAATYMNDVEAEMTRFSSQIAARGDTVIPLGQQPRQFVNMLKAPPVPKGQEGGVGAAFFPALTSLNQIIDGTRAVVEMFNSQYGENITDTQKAYVIGQIGRNPTDRSIYARNSDELETLRTAVTPT